MRDIVLDTYCGEGPLDTSADDWPGWRHIYVKIAEGSWGYLEHSGYKEVTIQILEEAKGFDTLGVYVYPRRNDYVHWLTQAQTFVRQIKVLQLAGFTIDYVVLDAERRNIVDANGNYPSGYGSWLWEMYNYIVNETGLPVWLYSDPYTRRDAFYRYGYRWIDEIPWICAQYPYSNQDSIEKVMEIWEKAVTGAIYPNTFPVDYKPVMWQVTDRYPAGDFFPQSAGADVNVWLADWRVLLNKPIPEVPKDTYVKRGVDIVRRFFDPRRNYRRPA